MQNRVWTSASDPLGSYNDYNKGTVTDGGDPPPTPSPLFLYIYSNIVHARPPFLSLVRAVILLNISSTMIRSRQNFSGCVTDLSCDYTSQPRRRRCHLFREPRPQCRKSHYCQWEEEVNHKTDLNTCERWCDNPGLRCCYPRLGSPW